jgi:putative membrane protein
MDRMRFLYWLVPWEFSPTVIVCCAIAALLYLRGIRRRPPGFWRQLAFWTGLVLIYLALHTYLDYYAEREFFIHRIQHLVLHHVGPFLIALSAPGPVMRAGLPLRWRSRGLARLEATRAWKATADVLFNPWIASVLFFGVIYLWLWPSIHFVAMLDWRLYRVMNWSVTVDGLMFWWLVLDRRACPPARLAPGVRVLVSLAVAVPQILIGALITFARHDLYPIYDICGRAFPSISFLTSQMIGGLVLWVPSAMMSVIAALIALRNWISLSKRGRLPQRVERLSR